MKRRHFLLGAASGASLLMLPRGVQAHAALQKFDFEAAEFSPVERTSRSSSSVVEGDEHEEAHTIFWDKLGYIRKKGGIPAATNHYDVVIVGAGISGLSAAYLLRGKKVLLLDGNSRFGGNSRSQDFGGTRVSQGAAYITNFEPGDDIDRLLTSLGIKRFMRKTTDQDEGVNLNGVYHKNFWQGSTDPKNAELFIRAREKFHDIYEHKFPDLPSGNSSGAGRAYFNGLDQISFAEWIQRELGNTHPHILEYITMYCWSSFSSTPAEISAAQGLNFFASDLEGINVFPGGNGFIAQAMFEKLKASPTVSMQAKSFVVDVRSVGGRAQVCFKNSSGALETVTATKCIVASPKLVAKAIVEGIPADQLRAMNAVKYRAYLVANLFLNKKMPAPGYDIFSLRGKNPLDTQNESKERVIADMVFADWATRDAGAKTNLTLYLPLPYTQAEQFLFSDSLYSKYTALVREKIAPLIKWSDVEGMRLVRYGHAVPVATRGYVANGTFERASAPIDNCIFFANQDNWGNACFETSFGSALEVVRKF